MKEPRGKELVARYVKNYGIAADTEISEQMVLAHWQLEKALTKELLNSAPENRWETFERCYDTLYRELPWLNKLPSGGTAVPHSERFRDWRAIIGNPPMKIYEVGSGKGEMIVYLASSGFECKGTEITRQRGKKFVATQQNLRWAATDGVHLDKFEPINCYDVVISNQVIEHLHPDDLCEHFKSCVRILKSEGRYILCTPHRYAGPHDVSRVFKCDEPKGMHLKEYRYCELVGLLSDAGFREISAVFKMPTKLRTVSGLDFKPRVSRPYLRYLCFLDGLISHLPTQALKRIISSSLKAFFFSTNMFLVATKV